MSATKLCFFSVNANLSAYSLVVLSGCLFCPGLNLPLSHGTASM